MTLRLGPRTRTSSYRPPLAVALLCAAAVLGWALGLGCGSSAPQPSPTPRQSGTAPGPSVVLSPSPGKTEYGVSVTSYGARGDGATDDTAALQAALAATARSGTNLAFPPGTYRVSSLTLPDGAALVAEQPGAAWIQGRVQVGSRTRVAGLKLGIDGAALTFVGGAADTLFQHVTFVGGGGMSSGADQGVIRFQEGRAASSISFQDCTIGANSGGGNGVSMVSNGWSGATYQDISWHRCHFLGSPRMTAEIIQRPDGVHPVSVGYRGIDFVQCLFDPSGSETLSYDAVGDAGYSTVAGCTFKGAGWNQSYPWGQGVEFNAVKGMRFLGNTMYRCRGAMINHTGVAAGGTASEFGNNVFDGTVTFIQAVPTAQTQTIYFNRVSGASFHDNVVKTDAGGELAYFDSSPGNTFRNDTWTDARPPGSAFNCLVLTESSSGNSFTGERFSTAASGAAVNLLNGSDHTSFLGCTFILPKGTVPVHADPGLTVTLTGTKTQ